MTAKVTLAAQGKDAGFAIVYAIPLYHDNDYHCFPPGLLAFEQAQHIARQLAKGKHAGQVGIYEWSASE
jgi:hypothetical protein